MRPKAVHTALLIAALFGAASLLAQSPMPAGSSSLANVPDSPDSGFRGWNAYSSFSGVADRSGTLLKLDSSVGYDFSERFGVFAGLPLYFAGTSQSASPGNTLRAAGAGDAYVGAEFYASFSLFRYSSTITIGFPTGNVAEGFSPGVVTADWTNRFRRSFGRLTPSFSVGLGNSAGADIGVIDSAQLIAGSRSADPYFHLDEGADYDLTNRVYLGGAAYHIIPIAHQSAAASASSDLPLNSVLLENGFDTWVGFHPNSSTLAEIGYSRSVTFGLNSLSFRFEVNLGHLLQAGAVR